MRILTSILRSERAMWISGRPRSINGWTEYFVELVAKTPPIHYTSPLGLLKLDKRPGRLLDYLRYKFVDHNHHMTFVEHIVYFWPEWHHLRPNKAKLLFFFFHKERLFNMKSCCRRQIPFSARTLLFCPRKGAFWRGQWPRVVIIIPLHSKSLYETFSLCKQNRGNVWKAACKRKS